MTDIAWPVEFVDDTGASHLAHDMAGAWGLVYGGCLLKRAVEGLPFKVALQTPTPPSAEPKPPRREVTAPLRPTTRP